MVIPLEGILAGSASLAAAADSLFVSGAAGRSQPDWPEH
jgi:hypothetical protein